MGKVIKLTETDLYYIVKKVLNEQTTAEINPKNLKFGAGGKNNPNQIADVKALQQKLMDLGFMKLKSGKPTGYFGQITQNALNRALGKTTTTTAPSTTTTPPKPTITIGSSLITCPNIEDSPNFRPQELSSAIDSVRKRTLNLPISDKWILNYANSTINKDAKYYKNLIPTLSTQSACEVASIGIRNKYYGKNVFIVDSPNKRIYLFGPSNTDGKRTLIAQDIIIDGKVKQRNDAESVANAFVDYNQRFEKLKKELKRNPTENEVWASFDKDKSTFLPAGIYKGTSTYRNPHYAGTSTNVLAFDNWLGVDASQALHGYVLDEPRRVAAMKKALSVVKDPSNTQQIEEFMTLLKSGGLSMDFSYGCINVPERFIPYIVQYGPGAFIFNIAEDNANYLVQNGENFFDKMMTDETCPSPESLGAEEASIMA